MQNSPEIHIAVLDTNVFLKDPYAIYSIAAPHLIVPFQVLQELDECKELSGSVGRHARQAIHVLESIRQKGNVHDGVPLNDEVDAPRLQITPPNFLGEHASDVDQIVLDTARHFAQNGKHTMLCTQDINLRLKAGELGIVSKAHQPTPLVLPHELAAVHTQPLPAKDLKALTKSKVFDVLAEPPSFINQFIQLNSDNNPENYRLFRYLGGTEVEEVHNHPIFGSFQAQNREQLMALDLLLDDSVKLVSLIGKAGTGKTFLVLLVGLLKMMHERVYKKIMVTRPTVALGPDIGFLPGDMSEKLDSWMQPVYDNINMIATGIKSKKMPIAFKVEDLQKENMLALQAITYMRGRSLPHQYLFVDEAQNLTPLELKTLITRAGVGTKVIIAGDPEQIDTPRLNYDTNGLMVTTRKFKGDKLFGVVHLQRSERSALAQRAAELL